MNAVGVVIKNDRASISLVQRHLRIGYNRAARLLEDMETAGVISPMDSSGGRKVLVDVASMKAAAKAVQNLHDLANKQGHTITLEQDGEVLATFGAQA